jgi:hypothetical protein
VCDNPNCNGIHNPSGGRDLMCPNAYARMRAKSKEGGVQRRRARRIMISVIKLNRGCIDCGYNANPEALDFDHKPDSLKLFDVGDKMHFATERILAEIAKCDVRCSNCHRIKTAERRKAANDQSS